jgi:Asp-tRNA(Asn)/Glu-tRNA(Gln) amidotransferase A subunit family amidase
MRGVVEIARALATGELSLAGYLDEILARLAERDPALQAFLPEENRAGRLAAAAAALLARWPLREGAEERPPLFGVPVGIKDIFRVDGLPTRAGSRLPPEEFAGPQAAAVSRLEAAGALVLGKTVSTEFAFFAPGPTRNPHDPERTPGGSSSGSAAAVGAGLCPLALGSQTVGSTIRPAAFCGVVGFKPSYGRISTAGVVPLAPSVDHVGIFTADVPGAALAASLLCDGWRGTPAVPIARDRRPRLGIPRGPYLEAASADGRAGFGAACARLAAAGFDLVEAPALEDFPAVVARHWRIVAAEAAQVHASWYGRFGALYSPRMRELIEKGKSVSAGELEEARAGRAALREELDQHLDRLGLGLWISPAAPGVAPLGLGNTGDPVMNVPWTQAGLPALTLPAGRSAGLPLGLQLVGRFGEDEALLEAAISVEQVFADEAAK